MIEFRLPYPISVNNAWNYGRGRVYKSKEYKAWIEAAGWEIKRQKVPSIAGAFSISVEVSRPDNRIRDIDNLWKVSMDILQKMSIISNDCECEDQHTRWVKSGEGILIRLEPAESTRDVD